MEVRKLASEIARIEGKKVQASIGNIREILKIAMIIMGKEMLKGIEEETVLVNQLKKYGKKN